MPDQTYVVHGRWPFPLDMLRHEDARAATEKDQAVIDLLTPDSKYGSVKDDVVMTAIYTVTLTRPVPHKWSSPNFARWRSFSWEVVQTSLPATHRELI